MIEPTNPNIFGWALALVGSCIVLFFGERLKHYFSREQREITREDRESKLEAEYARTQLEGWKTYAAQLTSFNTELNGRLTAMDKRLAERDDHIERTDARLADCERDRNKLWRRVAALGGGPIPDDAHDDDLGDGE